MCTMSGWDVCMLIQSNKAKKNFCCVWIAWYTVNTQVGGILISLYATWAGHSLQPSRVFITVLNSPNHSRVYIGLCKHSKSFSIICLNSIFYSETCGQNYFHIFSVKGNNTLKQTRRSMNNIGISFFMINVTAGM